MIIIGESIHVISSKVKKAIEERDKGFIQRLAVEQVEAGAKIVDLNIGPQRKLGAEIMPWMVQAVQEVTDVRLSLDTTNAAAIEAGIQVCKSKPIINSTDATESRLTAMMPLAAKYGCDIIALTLGPVGLPSTADLRIELAVDNILPAAMEYGVEVQNILFDPLVMTINGNQDQAIPTTDAIRFFKQMSDPPPSTTCGLSNVSNTCPDENRSLLNRVFLTMMAGAGLDTAIADALDPKLMEVVRFIENRDTSTPLGRLYVALFDSYAAGGPFDSSVADLSDPEQKDVVKTVDVLESKWIYAHSYLRL